MSNYRVEIQTVSCYVIASTVGDEADAIKEALALHRAGVKPEREWPRRVSVETKTVREIECQQK